MRSAVIIGGIAFAGVMAYVLWPLADRGGQESAESNTAGAALAEVVLPDSLSENAQIGKAAFEAKCASCHGTNAAGQDNVAPPIVHVIYEPSHHGDESFQRAAALGVQAHHWRFGNMPPVEGITRGDVSMIITYIRELQRANGIN